MGIIYKDGIPYGDQPPVDATLTHQGEAADAKATGDALSELRNTLSHKADVIYDTANGDIVSFPDGADGLPVKDLTVAIEPVQSGTGDPSPTNVRPISGWTGANVSRTGKNLYNILTRIEGYYIAADGTITQQDNMCYSDAIPVKVGFKYTLSLYYYGATNHIARLHGYDSNGNWVEQLGYISTTTQGKYSITTEIPSGISSVKFGYNYVYFSDVQLELGAPATAYEPYSSTTLPISWQSSAGTVYGGTLDVTSGVLTVDRAGVDMGTLTWNLSAGTVTRFNATPNPAIKVASNRSLYIQCSCYASNVGGGAYDPFTIYNVGNDIYVVDGTYESASDFATAVTGQIAVYPLATSLVIQLDPVTVTTLLGQNNIWADCGPSTVEYPCDTKLYIQKINTPTDDDMIADANIASGKYFIINNNLYLSTAAILAGDPIKPGTNCTLTNLAAALNAINS